MTAAIEAKIKAAADKLAKLKANKRKAEAQQRYAENKEKRKQDNHKKILVGAVVLANIEHGNLDKGLIYKLLDSNLTLNRDRALFGLSQLEPNYDMDNGKNIHG